MLLASLVALAVLKFLLALKQNETEALAVDIFGLTQMLVHLKATTEVLGEALAEEPQAAVGTLCSSRTTKP
jgi:uncharacterized membrane protein